MTAIHAHACSPPAQRRRHAAVRLPGVAAVLALLGLVAGPGSRAASPAEDSPESVALGRAVYKQNCTACHGANGKAQGNTMGNTRDLTAPELFKGGTSESALFATIQNGMGNGMPPFKSVLEDEDIRNVVKYIESLWKKPSGP